MQYDYIKPNIFFIRIYIITIYFPALIEKKNILIICWQVNIKEVCTIKLI